MDMTLNSLTNTFGTLPSLPNTGTITVAPTADTGLVQSAVDLSSEAGVIAQLGVPGVNLQTYNATGLLNQLVQSGTAPAALPIPVSGADTQEISQQLTDNAVVNTLASNPVDSGIYTSSGGFQNTGLDSNWASILKSNPSLAATVAGDTFTQGIVGTLFNVTA